MTPEQYVAQLQTAIVVLIAGVLVAIGYILTTPLPPERVTDPACPLHKRPRSKCKPEWHD